MITKSLLICATFIAGCMPAAGQEEDSSTGGSASEVTESRLETMDVKSLLARFDADADGKLSGQEREAVREFVRRSNERKRKSEATSKQWKEWVAAYDKDGDGRLAADERLAALAAIRELAGRGAASHNRFEPTNSEYRPQSQRRHRCGREAAASAACF